jgi:hypothetical protein
VQASSFRSSSLGSYEGRVDLLALLLAAAILVAIYAATLPPSLTWAHYGADGGDLAAAVALRRIPHPPGFPTYLLLGRVFAHLPWGDVAGRLSVMSAAFAAGSVLLTAASFRIVIRGERASDPSRFCVLVACTLITGLSPLLWSQALIVEVYGPAAFFSALLLYLALRRVPAWVLGLVWGVGLGVHPVLLFLAPLVVAVAGRSPSRVGLALLAGVAGWGLVYGPLLLVWPSNPSPWGDVSTLSGWWALVTGQLYRGYALGLPLAAWPRRLLAWAGLLARQFTPLGLVLVYLGWRRLRGGGPALPLALAFGSASLFALAYDTVDSFVYLVPLLPLAGVWLGVGLQVLAGELRRRHRLAVWLLLLLPVLQVGLWWGRMDLSAERGARVWAEGVLEEAPHGAVVITAQDAHTFTLWYVRDVLGRRPDVVVLDRDLWALPAYRQRVGEELGLGSVDEAWSPQEAAGAAGRPVLTIAVTTQAMGLAGEAMTRVNWNRPRLKTTLSSRWAARSRLVCYNAGIVKHFEGGSNHTEGGLGGTCWFPPAGAGGGAPGRTSRLPAARSGDRAGTGAGGAGAEPPEAVTVFGVA